MAERRAKGEGSIYQRGDGKWVGQVSFLKADGTRQEIRKVRDTQGAVRRELTKLKTKQDAHRLVVAGKGSVRNWLDVWLDTFVRPNRAPATFEGYHRLLKQNVPDSIGTMPLTRLAPETLQRHFNTIAEKHGRTAELLRSVLRSAFNKAVKLHRLEANPVLGTDAVQYKRLETTPFTSEEAQRFLRAAEDDRLGALFTIAVSLGLREGEVCGLKPEDVDLGNRVVHVRRSLKWLKLPGEKEGHWLEGEPKQHSRGDLPMTEAIYRALVRHIARRQKEASETKGWRDSGYLFTSVTGAPLHARNLLGAFHAVCTAANVPKIRFHDTRHTAGTMLHLQGANPFVIQKVLRHSQLVTTRRYVHVPVPITKAALDRVDALYRPPTDSAEKSEPAKPLADQAPASGRVQ